MTYPQQGPPQGYPPQGPYQQPQAPYYPPQAPQQNGWQAPVYQPPQQPQQSQQAAPNGSLDSFYSQPSAGHGPSWSFKDKAIGHTFVGIVARKITDADVQATTNPATGQIQTYRDGRPKFAMKVPVFVQPDQTYPEGKATWYVQGAVRDELARAMSEAGAPQGPPEVGAALTVKLVGRRPIPGMNPANVVEIRYQRPAGAAPVEAKPAQEAPVATAMVENHAPQQPQAAPQAPVGPPAQPAPQAPAQPVMAAPEGMPPEQAELLARLTGQAQQ